MVGRPQGHPPRFQTVLQKKKSAGSALFLLCGTHLGGCPWGRSRTRDASSHMTNVCFGGSGCGD